MKRSVVGLLLGVCGGGAMIGSCKSSTAPTSVSSIAVVPDTIRLTQGDTAILTVTPLDASAHLVAGISITFTSANPSIATVSVAGHVAAAHVGSTRITVSGGGASTDVPTIVMPKAAFVTVAPADTTIREGASFALRVSVLDSTLTLIPGAPVSFRSNDITVATVNASGVVTGVGGGATTLMVTSGLAVGNAPLVTVKDTNIVAHTVLLGSPFGTAASLHGAVYVLRHTVNVASRFDLPDSLSTASVGVAANPTYVAFDSAGAVAYVTAQFADEVQVISVASNTVTDSIAVTGDPFVVRVSPDDKSIWVSTNVDSLYQIDRATKTVLARYGLPLVPNGIAFSPANDSMMYVSTLNVGSVFEINYKRKTMGRTFSPGGTTQGVAVSLDGAELYVANESLGEIEIYNLISGTPAGLIATGSGAFDLQLSPDGTKIWVSLPGAGSVAAYSRTTRTLQHAIGTGGTPRRIAVTPASGLIVVANETGWVDFLK